MALHLKQKAIALIAIINVAVSAGMLLVGYSGISSPESHAYVAVLGLTFPFFLLLNLAFLVFWLSVKWKFTIISLLAFIAGYGPVRTYCPFNAPGKHPEEGIKVLSYNIEAYGYPRMWTDKKDDGVTAIEDYILRSNADIICLQESSQNYANERLYNALKARLPYRFCESTDSSGEMMTIYSRFPFKKTLRIPYPSYGNMTIGVEVSIEGHDVLVLNNHLESNKLQEDDKEEFRNIVKGNSDARHTRSGLRQLAYKLSAAARIRAPQAEAVHKAIAEAMEEGKSVICCGDFNDSPLSYAHRTIARGLTDAYVATANGPGFSYHRSAMYVRIDNILCSPDLTPYEATIDRSIADSDHYPIYCWLTF